MGIRLRFPAHRLRLGAIVTALLLWCGSGQAAEWSNTEFQLQIGNLDVPSFAGGGSADHVIYTLQHSCGSSSRSQVGVRVVGATARPGGRVVVARAGLPAASVDCHENAERCSPRAGTPVPGSNSPP